MKQVSVPDLRMLLIDIVDDLVDNLDIADTGVWYNPNRRQELKDSINRKINRAILEGDV